MCKKEEVNPEEREVREVGNVVSGVFEDAEGFEGKNESESDAEEEGQKSTRKEGV